jgi:hypothetical protein
VALALWALMACKPPAEDPAEVHPTLVVTPDRKQEVLDRIDEEPWATALTSLQERAARPREEHPDPEAWDPRVEGRNAETAQAAAMLAWLLDDDVMAAKSKLLLGRMETHYETHGIWDINIRMPASLIGYTNAVDLLMGTPYLDEADAEAAIEKITTVNDAFFDQYVEDDFARQATLGFSQNNHPIRTASAIGYVAIAFPEHVRSKEQADWAVSELDYLWGPGGRYVQPDGGVSEGPFYYSFAFGPAIAFLIAMDNAVEPEREFARDCRNRQDVDPWVGHGCVEGEAFTFDNPLHSDLFSSTVDWWIAIRLPSGNCPPLADAYFNPLNGAALLTSFSGTPQHRWSWENNVDRSRVMTGSQDLLPHHLVYVDPEVQPAEPAFATRFLPDAGNAVFRSGWDADARWLMLVAEHGAARKTLHDHVDGLSFSMAAYGEYLLVDPGYYKPVELTLTINSQAHAHNVVLVDGRGAPNHGILFDFGDEDAFLRNTWDGDRVDYAEAHQRYREVDFERSVVMVRDRYFVVADRLSTAVSEPREYSWRLGGYAGYDSGGTFILNADGATWERSAAGVDVHLASTAPGLVVAQPGFVELEAPHVHQFELNREVNHHAVIDGVVNAEAPEFLAVLAPYRVGDAGPDGPLGVTSLDLGAGVAAWTIEGGGHTDVVLLREADAPTTFVLPDGVEVETDAELVVVGTDLALVVRGTTLEVDGVMRATTGEPFVVVEN